MAEIVSLDEYRDRLSDGDPNVPPLWEREFHGHTLRFYGCDGVEAGIEMRRYAHRLSRLSAELYRDSEDLAYEAGGSDGLERLLGADYGPEREEVG